VRQTESAALKAAGDNKSAPFTRSLTGLFTAATLEAAEKADKLGKTAGQDGLLHHIMTSCIALDRYECCGLFCCSTVLCTPCLACLNCIRLSLSSA